MIIEASSLPAPIAQLACCAGGGMLDCVCARLTSANAAPTVHYLLFYDFVSDYLERRAALRDEHLTLAWQAHTRGELVLGGALAEPVDGAVLFFSCDSPAPVEAFAKSDPYVRHNLVTRWRVRPWSTVAGAGAATPVRPTNTGKETR